MWEAFATLTLSSVSFVLGGLTFSRKSFELTNVDCWTMSVDTYLVLHLCFA